ncbi:MAG: hypothetical protein DMF72_21010 [Acidobacteria bacterium]|nr:MAG: hypothetical protein DMF72_21010 [Acidobacteriota bacterium]
MTALVYKDAVPTALKPSDRRLTVRIVARTLGLRTPSARAEIMIGRFNSYRYYWYYGPLSAGRDGRAMSCRETIE